jgi:predicted ATPase
MNNKIGFNNFKSFGEKVQTFSQKPITLIYGPNSIGKSSILHFLLYMEYLKESGNIDLEVSNFAGDPIDLGGFKNFIHKKDNSKKISYQLTLQTVDEIAKYFTPLFTIVKNFEKEGAFDHEIDAESILKRIKRFRIKDPNEPFVFNKIIRSLKAAEFLKNLPLKNMSKFDYKYIKHDYKYLKQAYFEIFLNTNQEILPDSLSEQKKIFENCIASEISLKHFFKRNDSQPLDELDKLILYIADIEGFQTFDSHTERKTPPKGDLKVKKRIAKLQDEKLKAKGIDIKLILQRLIFVIGEAQIANADTFTQWLHKIKNEKVITESNEDFKKEKEILKEEFEKKEEILKEGKKEAELELELIERRLKEKKQTREKRRFKGENNEDDDPRLKKEELALEKKLARKKEIDLVYKKFKDGELTAEEETVEFDLIIKRFKDDELAQAAGAILQRYQLFYSINAIRRIKVNIEFGIEGEKPHYSSEFYIDNDLLYTYNSNTKSFTENKNNSILKKIEESNIFGSDANISSEGEGNFFESKNLLKQMKDTFSHFNGGNKNFLFDNLSGSFITNLNRYLFEAIKNINITRKPQYLGPLRFLPDRENRYKINSNSTKEIEPLNYSTKEIKFNLQNSYLFLMNLGIPGGKIRYLGRLIYFLLFNGKFLISQLIADTKVLDSINIYRSNKNKISSNNSMNSEQFWSDFINSPEKQRSVNDWLSDSSKLKTSYNVLVKPTEKLKRLTKLFRLKPKIQNELVFIDKRTETEVTPREMGLGMSQVLPILISTQTLENHKIFIEQPELHLHPAVQCEIADEFIKSANTQNNEFVIESHSEHLLLRMMKRMRQTAEGVIAKDNELALTPDDVCLLYVDHNGEMTYLNELELDEDGSLLDPWPHGFFEEGYHERFG